LSARGRWAAGGVRKLNAGAAPEDVAKEFAGSNAIVIQAELENDPKKQKFAPFWEAASGAKIGDVIGPVTIVICRDRLVRW